MGLDAAPAELQGNGQQQVEETCEDSKGGTTGRYLIMTTKAKKRY